MVLISSKIFHLTYTTSLIISIAIWLTAEQLGSTLDANFGTWIGYWFISGISIAFMSGMRRETHVSAKNYYQTMLASFPSLPLILLTSELVHFIAPNLGRFAEFTVVAVVVICVYALCYQPLKKIIGRELEKVFVFKEKPAAKQ